MFLTVNKIFFDVDKVLHFMLQPCSNSMNTIIIVEYVWVKQADTEDKAHI